AAHEMFGLNSIVFRPHNVYGEHQNIGDRYRNVIGIFMNQLMQGQSLSVFGDGLQTRAFSYIDDVAPHIARSVSVPAAYNETINIGADEPHTVLHLAEVVSRAFGADPKIARLEPRNEVVHAYASHDKARAIFGETEAVPLEHGIERMAAWARRVGARQSSTFGEIEIPKKLPPSWRTAK
ncbi:MAG: NAD-dependent epimerase/dehydratase family protein, partial [Gemmatimonadaceae bacterium]